MAKTGSEELRVRFKHGWLVLEGYHAEAMLDLSSTQGDPWIDSNGRLRCGAWEPREQWDISIRPIGPVRFERDGDAAG